MTDGPALLQAVLDEPEDDLPRLAYADWLDENGDEARAEFIRVQIERTRLPSWDERQSELAARERRLLLTHGAEWAPKAPLYFFFRRGFVERVGGSPQRLRNAGEELESAHPVRAVDIWNEGTRNEARNLGPLGKMRFWRRVRSLSVRLHYWREVGRQEPLSVAEVLRLFQGKHLVGIRRLVLGPRIAEEEGDTFRELLALPSLRGLRSLQAGDLEAPDSDLMEITSERLAALGEVSFARLGRRRAPFVRRLVAGMESRGRSLSVTTFVPDEVGRHMARCAERGAIRSVSLMEFDVLGRLLGLSSWGQLEGLFFGALMGSVPTVWAERLVEHPGFARLRKLHITGGVATLLSASFPMLEELVIDPMGQRGPNETREMTKAVTRPGAYPRLRNLTLSGYEISPDAMRQLLSSPLAAGLRRLRFVQGIQPHPSIMELVQCPYLTQLNELEVWGRAPIGPGPFLAFVRNEAFANLTRLVCWGVGEPYECYAPFPPGVIEECLSSPRLTEIDGLPLADVAMPRHPKWRNPYPSDTYRIIEPDEPMP